MLPRLTIYHTIPYILGLTKPIKMIFITIAMGNNFQWKQWVVDHGIWLCAFGYSALYIPYCMLAKLLSNGYFGDKLAGLAILPLYSIANTLAAIAFMIAIRFWRYTNHVEWRGLRIPRTSRYTFLSGMCSAVIMATTTLAYTFEGVSIVFAMLLMRGGVLIIAPVVDALSRRKVQWFSWAGLALAMLSLLVSLVDTTSYAVTGLCAIDIAAYLLAYFFRLRAMSHMAKSRDTRLNIRYFVEEQIVASPALLVLLAVVAATGAGGIGSVLRQGFTAYWLSPALGPLFFAGILSFTSAIFGTLVFLDHRENSFCVPVNRASSVLAGVIASYLMLWFPNQRAPQASQLVGAAFIVLAIGFLSIPPLLAKRRLAGRATEALPRVTQAEPAKPLRPAVSTEG